ncbi:hypothetical protein [Serratia marcescens]|nr:hypothetical protein [Serratia marcescens]CAI1070479.1 Uncharacterised protein [Serratia marcescens]CAI1117006.1 Uncharacterised protein [Serratia marcescens]
MQRCGRHDGGMGRLYEMGRRAVWLGVVLVSAGLWGLLLMLIVWLEW